MATDVDALKQGERISAIEASLKHVSTKADINRLDGKIDSGLERLEGKIDTGLERLEGKVDTGLERLEGKIDINYERLSGQIRWLMVLVLLALAASAPDVITLLS